MTRTSDYGPLHSDQELDTLAFIQGQAFGPGTQVARQWLTPNRPHIRVIRREGQVVGGLLQVPMGQFFGGRRVAMTGIAGVGILPAARGQGVATALMHATVRELHRAGTALSTLYPATYPLYRRAGYELAGSHHRIRISPRALPNTERTLPVRAMEPGDTRAVERLYRAHAATCPGWLDRGDYIWNRVRHGCSDTEIHGIVVPGDKGLEGYLFYTIKPLPEPMDGLGYDVRVTDMASTTPRAALRLLAFLADHRAQARHVIWHGGTDDPFVHILPELGYHIALHDPWMLRLIHVRNALAERGYPRHVKARLDLHVSDDLLRANSGRLVLDVAGGAAEARPGGRGSLKLHVRALASLYSGHMSPHQLAALGLLDGPAAALDKAAALFAGPAPSLRDYF